MPVKQSMLTGFGIPQGDDKLFSTSATKTLYPSPASGRGSRLFLFLHVVTHLVTLALLGAMLGETADKLNSDNIDGGEGALILSFLMFILGVVTIVGLSSMSKKPFLNGLSIVLICWSFLASFGLNLFSLVSMHGTLATDATARTLAIFTVAVQSLGLAFVMAALTSGVAATVPSDAKLAAVAGA